MKALSLAVFVILGLTIFLIGIIVYYIVFDDNPPFEIYNLPLPSEKDVYRPGETLRLYAEFCRFTDAPYTIYGQIENSRVYIIPERHFGGTEIGHCNKAYTPGIMIPEDIPPGIYHYVGRSVYHVNPIADRVVTWSSQPFEVIE